MRRAAAAARRLVPDADVQCGERFVEVLGLQALRRAGRAGAPGDGGGAAHRAADLLIGLERVGAARLVVVHHRLAPAAAERAAAHVASGARARAALDDRPDAAQRRERGLHVGRQLQLAGGRRHGLAAIAARRAHLLREAHVRRRLRRDVRHCAHRHSLVAERN